MSPKRFNWYQNCSFLSIDYLTVSALIDKFYISKISSAGNNNIFNTCTLTIHTCAHLCVFFFSSVNDAPPGSTSMKLSDLRQILNKEFKIEAKISGHLGSSLGQVPKKCCISHNATQPCLSLDPPDDIIRVFSGTFLQSHRGDYTAE